MIQGDGTACLTDARLYVLTLQHLLPEDYEPQIPDTVAYKTARYAEYWADEDNLRPPMPTKYDDLFALAATVFHVCDVLFVDDRFRSI